jgi:hypothetical protein
MAAACVASRTLSLGVVPWAMAAEPHEANTQIQTGAATGPNGVRIFMMECRMCVSPRVLNLLPV